MLCNLKRSILGLAFLSSLAAASGYDEQYPPGGGVGGKQDGKKPNFIFILTDDQDLHLDSLSYMPQLKKHITDQGTAFEKHYCTIAICCPSRVSLLTGRAAHNTNVTDVSPPYGGYPKFISEGWNEKYLPVWLQEAGYDTYYTGKLMNGFSTSAYNKPYPKGWTGTDFFLDPSTYTYYNVTMQRNGEPPKAYPGEYSTDLVTDRSLGFLDEAIPAGNPFFLGIAPIAPHSQTINSVFWPAVPADRHKDLLPGLKAPRTANFNPDTPSGGSWIKTLEKLNETTVDYIDEFYRTRILSLFAVDELVDKVVKRLEADPEVLENTYIIYTTDNGFHVGQHRLAPGKTCPIEEDVHIPFVVRGPGVAKGKTIQLPTSHTDIVPTLFELAGIPLQDEFDGQPIPVTERQQRALTQKTEHVNVEFWGEGILEGTLTSVGPGVDGTYASNNTYKSLRVISENYNLAYTVWCSNEHELYEMISDPGQLHNLYEAAAADDDNDSSYNSVSKVYDWDKEKLLARLDALLLTLKACKGATCRRPWAALHPQGDVETLEQAMSPAFDAFYAAQDKVSFSQCALGYIAAYEGPLASQPFVAPGAPRLARWEDWT